jgi:alpha-galactosidase
MIAATPPMGWNSWNTFGKTVNENIIKEVADALVSNGLRDLGYVYVNIDDHWQAGRDEWGRPFPYADRFPNGIKALADYIHEHGLKFGLYSDASEHTCGGEIGSLAYEEIDAQCYAEWGVDYLKYDYCHAPPDRATAIYRYAAMGKALRATGRPIVYSICEWGNRQPWLWAAMVGGHMWRTTGDVWDGWGDNDKNTASFGIERIGFEMQRGLEIYAGPSRWNDPDMLVVGMRGRGNVSLDETGCTNDEYKTQFSLWCMLAAPLIIGCDVRNLDTASHEILSNKEVIALDQDALGKQGCMVAMRHRTEIYKKPLLFGDLGVGIFNRNHEPYRLRLFWSDLEIIGCYHVRDLWAHKDLGVYDDTNELWVELPPHGCSIFRLSPTDL